MNCSTDKMQPTGHKLDCSDKIGCGAYTMLQTASFNCYCVNLTPQNNKVPFWNYFQSGYLETSKLGSPKPKQQFPCEEESL